MKWLGLGMGFIGCGIACLGINPSAGAIGFVCLVMVASIMACSNN